MTKVMNMELLTDELEGHQQQISTIRNRLAKLMRDGTRVESPLMRLPKAKREMYETFFGLIYECSTNRAAATALVDRIISRLISK
jgi:hypothetical protein